MSVNKETTSRVVREHVADRLLAIGRMELDMERCETLMNKRIDSIKAEFSPGLEELGARIAAARAELELFFKKSGKGVLGARRSMKTLFGRVGWRTRPDQIAIHRGVSEPELMRRLMARDLMEFVRQRLALNKEAIKTALRDGRITEKQLHALGLRVKPGGEQWVCEVDKASVRKELERA